MFFPHMPDPDSRDLKSFDYESIASLPIEEHLSRLKASQSVMLAEQAMTALRTEKPDILLLTTCHAGPETKLLNLLNEQERARVIVVGCQHGFAQQWQVYWNNFSFNYLLVFGTHFANKAPEPFRQRVIVAGLPKLDAIAPNPACDFEADRRPILYAAFGWRAPQTYSTERIAETLAALGRVTGRQIVIKPHPEFRDAFSHLKQKFVFVDAGGPIVEEFARVSMVITTGSTVALEALAARVPVVVLPEQRGERYEDAGIVARSMDPTEILEIGSRQSEPQFRERLDSYLEMASGSRISDRAVRTANCLESLEAAEARSQWPIIVQ